jgi:hypothetical protein
LHPSQAGVSVITRESQKEERMPDKRNDHALAWISALDKEGRNLTPWEKGFLLSVMEQRKRGTLLTTKQLNVLESIYSEKTP